MNLGFTIENNILKGTEDPPPPSEYKNLGELVLKNLNDNPDFIGQIDAITGQEQNYRTIRDRSVRCALWMKANGILPGDVVVICSHNQLEMAMPFFASIFLGAIVNPLDVELTPCDFRAVMTINKPKIAFVNENSAALISQIAKELNLDLKVVVLGRLPDFLEFENIITESRIDEVENFQCTPLENSNHIAVIMCTSGTTGLSKGVSLSHSALLTQTNTTKLVLSYDRSLIFTSLSWLTGVCHMISSFCLKLTKIVPPPFEEYTACELIEKLKITYLFLAPKMVHKLLKSAAIKKYNLSTLKLVMCGGAALDITSQLAFAKIIPHAQFVISYGMTEVGGIMAVQVPGSKRESSGHIMPNAQVKVVDINTGETLGPNQQGELYLKKNTMMNGYYNLPEVTAKAMDDEGWVHSGDLGYYDEDGYIFIVDRMTELIKYRDHLISPVEIENILLSHLGVKETAVVGLSHPEENEHPIAFVVRTDSTVYEKEVTEKELIDYVAARVTDSKRLRGGVKFVDSLPKTPSSKIQRRNLRAFARSMALK